jgi:3-hydroxyacyl-CoA dehydrogenase/enoyl-CoA hydratase/3-hydroxybutyryl-CoA epimerase
VTEPASFPIAQPGLPSAFRVEPQAGVAILWFDLPGEKVNKLATTVMQELDRTLDDLQRSDVKRLLLASAKPNNFIAGADVHEFLQVQSPEQAEAFVRFGHAVFTKLARLPQITVAVINGPCFGGGTELALNCDYRLMSDHPKARIGLPEVRLGVFPAWTGTTRLPRLIGIPAALDIILKGKSLEARRARRAGLVDEVVPDAILMQVARQFALRKQSKRSDKSERTHFYIEGNPLARKFIFQKARRAVLAETKGNYPAPLKVLEVMEIGFRKGYEAGLRAEAREVSRLVVGEVARNLIRLFFMTEAAKKDRGGTARPVAKAGVLGAGVMGGGIAQIIADQAEIPVRIKDVNWQAVAGGLQSASRVFGKQLERKRVSRADVARKMALITAATDWDGFQNVDLLIEAVVEKLEVKQEVLGQFEAVAKPEAIFATNTSTIPITRIAAAAQRPQNVVGMHFFNPVDKMPLVEVIIGKETSQDSVATVSSFARRLGKTVVVCNDAPGFIVNRLLAPYINEASFLLLEGNSIESIDEAVVQFGMPMGPLALLEEVGIDVAGKAAQVMSEAFGDRIPSSPVVPKLIADQRFGKKNARGLYRWKDGKRTEPDPEIYRLFGIQNPRSGMAAEMIDRMVLSMVNEAAVILEERVAFSADDLDLAMILGTGFPPFRGGLLRHADSLGTPAVVKRLEQLAAKHGPRFHPTPPLKRLASEGATFYHAYPA